MRRLALAAVCGTLVLAACSDQGRSPTEPSAPPPPAENFGTTCDHGRYPFATVAPLTQDAQIFPTRALRGEALLRVGVIALLWDTCHDQLARKAVVATLTWIDTHARLDNQDRINREKALDDAILNGLGGGATNGDVVTGLFVPTTPGTFQYFTTSNGDASIQLDGDAFAEPTLITIRRLPNTFTLTVPEGLDQAPPYYDYDATNSHTDNTVDTHKPKFGSVVMAFCFEPVGQTYPTFPGAQIGHNPVGGGFEFVPEVPIPSALLAKLFACNGGYGLGSDGGGLPGLGNLTWSSAGHYLARLAQTLFLPTPLRAATVGTLGPIAGKPVSLSPFGIVLPSCTYFGSYDFCYGE